MSTVALKAALAAKLKANNELRELYEKNEGQESTPELRAAEEALDAEIKKQDERMASITNSMELEERAQQALNGSISGDGNVDDGSEEEVRSEQDIISSLDYKQSYRSLPQRVETRDNVTLNKGTATDGAEVVPTTLFGMLTAFLRENGTAMMRLGKQINTAAGEDLVFPRVTSYSAASIVAELGTIGKDSPQFDTVTLGAYKYAFLTALSNELLQDQGFSIVPWLVAQGGEAMSRGAGAHLISGSGSGQPNGIFTAATTGVTAAGAAAITADELIDLQHSVATPYRRRSTWLMNDSTVKLIRKLKDGDNQYLWQPGLTLGAPNTLLGHAVETDENCPAATTGLDSVLFGDLDTYVVRTAKGAEVVRSDEFGYDSDTVFWRFIMRIDGDLIDTNGVRVLTQA